MRFKDPGQIPRLIRSLNRTNPVRAVAEAIEMGINPPPDSLGTLTGVLYRIHRRRWKEQVVAAWCLGRIPLDEGGKSAATRSLSWILDQRPGHSTGCFILSGCLFTYLGFLWIAYTSLVDGIVNRIRAAAAESLGLLALPEAAEPLTEAIGEMKGKAASGDRAVRFAAADALPRVLHKLPDTGYGQFSNETVVEVCRLLAAKESEPVYSALEILRLMGGGSAIDSVERLGLKHKDSGIRQASATTLEALYARREKERHRETLLRATTSPAAPGDELLRPAAHTLEDNPSVLLRSSNGVAESDNRQENRQSATEYE